MFSPALYVSAAKNRAFARFPRSPGNGTARQAGTGSGAAGGTARQAAAGSGADAGFFTVCEREANVL